jgi:hypothetical protein
MASLIDRHAAPFQTKFGVAHYGFGVVTSGLIALGGVAWTIFTFTHYAPKIIITPRGLVCDTGAIAWQDVRGITQTTDGRLGEYAAVALDPMRPKERYIFALIDGDVFSCEIDGTPDGYVAVYNAIQTGWAQAKETPAP